jgi:hypothetical protein
MHVVPKQCSYDGHASPFHPRPKAVLLGFLLGLLLFEIERRAQQANASRSYTQNRANRHEYIDTSISTRVYRHEYIDTSIDNQVANGNNVRNPLTLAAAPSFLVLASSCKVTSFSALSNALQKASSVLKNSPGFTSSFSPKYCNIDKSSSTIRNRESMTAVGEVCDGSASYV